LDKNTLCFVASMFNAKDVEMAITDQEGKVVYEYTEGMSQLMLEKGEYTIEINCSVTDKNSKLDSVKYIVEIISFAEFEITDTAEDDGEPGGIDFSESY
ncbi:MAG: hypothetical protein IKU52_03115, partial [Clostridia bacterium]|nr:hypothetical protein [Clostridia bacterium]